LNINFQSLKKKGKLLEAIIETTEPDIIIGTLTWLDSNIKSSEIIPDYFQYNTERRDRPKDPHGGVIIAAKQSLQLGNITKGKDIQYTPSVSTIILSGPTYSSQNVRQMSDKFESQHSLSPTIWSDILVGRESGY
jgi:hypothetical protein